MRKTGDRAGSIRPRGALPAATGRGARLTPPASPSGRQQPPNLPAVERARATVLVADVRGLAALVGRLDPEVAAALFADLFSLLADVGVAQRACIERFAGHALMFLYGIPRPRRDDGARAVRTAVDLQRAFLCLRNRWLREGRTLAGELRLAVGVASGHVVRARASNEQADRVIGEPVEGAARLSGAAQAGEVLVDEATYGAASAELDKEMVFTSREVALRNHEAVAVYRVQPQRAGLRMIVRRASKAR